MKTEPKTQSETEWRDAEMNQLHALYLAAPDLLAALEALERFVTNLGVNGAVQSVMKARAAIAKAKGEQ